MFNRQHGHRPRLPWCHGSTGVTISFIELRILSWRRKRILNPKLPRCPSCGFGCSRLFVHPFLQSSD
ncbi:hypothetical protein Mapa_015643 [Marchantia paleacea]|nr:hypothetical protein Mapa_015643 [Marchantia paleacea]